MGKGEEEQGKKGSGNWTGKQFVIFKQDAH